MSDSMRPSAHDPVPDDVTMTTPTQDAPTSPERRCYWCNGIIKNGVCVDCSQE